MLDLPKSQQLEYFCIPGNNCSACLNCNLQLNQYGVCANCWSDYTPKDRLAIHDGTIVVEREKIVYVTEPKGRTVVAWVVIGYVVSALIHHLLTNGRFYYDQFQR